MSKGIIQGLKKNRRCFVMFLIGMGVGAGLFLIVYGQKIDSLLSERNAIYYANNQKYKEILDLRQELEQWNKKRHPAAQQDTIKKIVIEVDHDQPYIVDAVKMQVEEKMAPFLNKSMQWLGNNPDLVELLLEKHQILVDPQQQLKIQIHLKYISFYDSTLKIWVQAEELSSDGVTDLVK